MLTERQKAALKNTQLTIHQSTWPKCVLPVRPRRRRGRGTRATEKHLQPLRWHGWRRRPVEEGAGVVEVRQVEADRRL